MFRLTCSYEGNALEDPWVEPDESMFTRSVSPESVSRDTGRVNDGHHAGITQALMNM